MSRLGTGRGGGWGGGTAAELSLRLLKNWNSWHTPDKAAPDHPGIVDCADLIVMLSVGFLELPIQEEVS